MRFTSEIEHKKANVTKYFELWYILQWESVGKSNERTTQENEMIQLKL